MQTSKQLAQKSIETEKFVLSRDFKMNKKYQDIKMRQKRMKKKLKAAKNMLIEEKRSRKTTIKSNQMEMLGIQWDNLNANASASCCESCVTVK